MSQPTASAEGGAEAPRARPRQASRIGTVLVGAYVTPGVKRLLKGVAAAEDTTVQSLIARAINDLLETRGHGRPASEALLPRGGAAKIREPSR